MIAYKLAEVTSIRKSRSGVQEIFVSSGGVADQKAICYTAMVGSVEAGDRVIINTTAVDLGLGTGGYHFVLWNLNRIGCEELNEINAEKDNDVEKAVDLTKNAGGIKSPGHIMKLRYTPLQLKCLSVEEEDSPYHELVKDKISIDKMPVIIGTLHSQLPAIAVAAKELKHDVRIAYIMTDGAALPIAFSNVVAELKDKGLIDSTITVGHAFGGDLEAVNIYSGLVAAKYVAKADIAIVCMGPGIVGTSTALGFTGIEQGHIINAVNSLQGCAYAVPRISFADKRSRHYGISHHSVTALSLAATTKATVVLPQMEEEKARYVAKQMDEAGLAGRHEIVTVDAEIVIDSLKKKEIFPTTMGRGIDEEAEFFKAAGAAAVYVLKGY